MFVHRLHVYFCILHVSDVCIYRKIKNSSLFVWSRLLLTSIVIVVVCLFLFVCLSEVCGFWSWYFAHTFSIVHSTAAFLCSSYIYRTLTNKFFYAISNGTIEFFWIQKKNKNWFGNRSVRCRGIFRQLAPIHLMILIKSIAMTVEDHVVSEHCWQICCGFEMKKLFTLMSMWMYLKIMLPFTLHLSLCLCLYFYSL